jgi:hypothetical protein
MSSNKLQSEVVVLIFQTVKLGAHWIELAQHGTALLRSGKRLYTASEPVGTRDPVLFHYVLEHDREFIICAYYYC